MQTARSQASLRAITKNPRHAREGPPTKRHPISTTMERTLVPSIKPVFSYHINSRTPGGTPPSDQTIGHTLAFVHEGEQCGSLFSFLHPRFFSLFFVVSTDA